MNSEFWNERYAAEGLAYGEAPNDFLVSVADRLPKVGKAIDIGAGEGRNAIYLASAAGYNRMAKFDLNGKLLTYWGMTGSAPGLFDNPHQFAVDDQGNLFIADAWNNRLQKFTPKPDADKSRLMTTEYVFPKK